MIAFTFQDALGKLPFVNGRKALKGIGAYLPKTVSPEEFTEDSVITETIPIYFSGRAIEVRETVQEIESWLQKARDFEKDKLGYRVYVQVLTEDLDKWQRTELLTGKIEFPDGEGLKDGNLMEAGLIIQRRAWWEDVEEKDLALITPYYPDGRVGGVGIHNHCDVVTTVVSGEVLATGDGSWETFLGFTDYKGDGIIPGSVTVQWPTNGEDRALVDNGAGVFVSINDRADGSSSTINYSTGALTIKCRAIGGAVLPPDNGSSLLISYTYLTGHWNWVEIDDTDGNILGGNIPARMKLQISNNENVALETSDIFVGQQVFRTASDINTIIEIENGTGTGSTITDAKYSGGKAVQLDTGEYMEYVIDSADLAEFEYKWYKLLLVFDYVAGKTCNVQIQTYAGTVPVQDTGSILLTYTPNENGSIKLPPIYLGNLSLIANTLKITNVGDSVITDFIHLMPLDGLRIYVPTLTLSYENSLFDDGFSGTVYTYMGGMAGGYIASHSVRGDTLKVHPNKKQRFYFLHETSDGSLSNNRSSTIRIIGRARRLSI